MQISRWLVIALSVASAMAAVVLIALPKEWIQYVVIGGAMLFVVFFMAFNVLKLLSRDRRKKGNVPDSDIGR